MNYNECGGCSGNGVNYGGTAVNAGAAYAAGGTCYGNADNYGTAAYYGNTTYANTASAAAASGGRDIWLDSTPITSATSHLLPGPLPRQQGAPPPQRQPVTAGAIPAADAADVTPDADAAGEGLAAAHVI